MTRAIITGASGYVGRNLAPLLAKEGWDLLLVGRDAGRLAREFPGYETCDYEGMVERAGKASLIVHLATANNDGGLPESAFTEANIDLPLRIANDAVQAGIPLLINISSTHALDGANLGAYARSKRSAAELLDKVAGVQVVTVHLPLVYAETWGGRLSVLNRLPGPVAIPVFRALAATKPTVNVTRLAEMIMRREAEPEKPLILSDGQSANPVYWAGKRLIDLAFAVGIIVSLWWLLALVWFAIRLHSSGPGVFRQERVGRNGASFICYKFRTMRRDTVQAGTHEVSASEVSGRLGRFLRRTKIDELPQVWNIIRNEISLVGPRPCLPTQVELVEARRRRGVLKVMPGITGLAQIEDIDMSDPERLARKDREYVALQSLLLDLRILVATAVGRGQGDKVASAG